MRLLLFAVAFVIGIALTAPLERWILPRLRGPLAAVGADLRVDKLRFALPFGLRASGVGLETAAAGIGIDSLYVGLTRSFAGEACGGKVDGHIGSRSLSMHLSAFDPSRCLHVGKLELESALDGSLSVDGLELLRPVPDDTTAAHIDVSSSGGVFRGVIPRAGSGGTDLPLGEWEFSDLVLRATLARGELTVEEGHTNTSGVEWELIGAALSSKARGGLRVDFRARQVEDTPRSRALIGLMPRATVDSGGWRNYRVVGSLAAPRVVAAN